MKFLPASFSATHDVCLIVLCVILVVASGSGLAIWERSFYMDNTGSYDKATYIPFTGVDLFGLSLFITFCALAVCAIYVTTSTHLHAALTQDWAVPVRRDSGQSNDQGQFTSDSREATMGDLVRRRRRIHIAVAQYIICAAGFFILGIVAAMTWGHDPLFVCGVAFCVGDPALYPVVSTQRPTSGLSFNATVGMMAFLVLVPLSIVMGLRLFSLRVLLRDVARFSRFVPLAQAPNMPPPPPPKTWLRDLLLGILPMTVFLIACSIVTFYLPNDTRRFSGERIARIAVKRATYGSTKGNNTAPEVPGAWFRTKNLALSDAVVLRLYPGNMFFYGYLLLLMITMWLLRLTVLGRTWLRAPVKWWPRQRWNYSDLLLASMTALFTFFFFFYWAHDHNYKTSWNEKKGPSATGTVQSSELWGRALGQLAIFFLSLLMFPASRSSSLPLFRAMGLTWESFLWVHRVLGYGMLLATLGHVIAFLVNFHENGVLRHNLTSQPTLVGQKKVRSDFTIVPVTWATLLVFVAMGVFALAPIRRRFFELFYYSHLIGAYVLFPAVLWHAAAGWEYLLPGLTLWLLDRFIRMYRSSGPVEVLGCSIIDGNVLRLDFRCLEKVSRVRSGQFAFLNVPEISLLEWHPFTVLSTSVVEGGVSASRGAGSGDTSMTVFIKAVNGPGSWTRRLYDRVAAAEAQFGRPLLTLRVDGPCGSPLGGVDLGDYSSVYIVAGGIGSSPCFAVYHNLLAQHRYHRQLRQHQPSKKTPPAPTKVRLLWVSRSQPLVESHAAMLVTEGMAAGSAGGARDAQPATADNIDCMSSEWSTRSATSSSGTAVVGPVRQTTFSCKVFLTGTSTPGIKDADNDTPLVERLGEDAQHHHATDVTVTDLAPAAPAPEPLTDVVVESKKEGHHPREEEEEDGDGGAGAEHGATSPPPGGSHEEGAPAATFDVAAASQVTYQQGRPNLLEELSTAELEVSPEGTTTTGTGRSDERVLVFACGPSKMLREVASVASKLGATFYREEFEL